MQASFYFFVIFEKWSQRWDWVAIIAYFGMTEWLNHYVVGKIGFEFGVRSKTEWYTITHFPSIKTMSDYTFCTIDICPAYKIKNLPRRTNARDWSRTSTHRSGPAPQAGASAYSATRAFPLIIVPAYTGMTILFTIDY